MEEPPSRPPLKSEECARVTPLSYRGYRRGLPGESPAEEEVRFQRAEPQCLLRSSWLLPRELFHSALFARTAEGSHSALYRHRFVPCAGILLSVKVTISACVLELTRHNANNGETCSGIHARNPDISLLRNLWMFGGTLATRADTNRKKTKRSIKMLGQGAPVITICGFLRGSGWGATALAQTSVRSRFI